MIIEELRMSDLNKMVNPLSIIELKNIVREENDYIGNHIWVKELETGIVFSCVLDELYGTEIVAVYGANDESEWFYEKDYGKTWVAYLERPV